MFWYLVALTLLPTSPDTHFSTCSKWPSDQWSLISRTDCYDSRHVPVNLKPWYDFLRETKEEKGTPLSSLNCQHGMRGSVGDCWDLSNLVDDMFNPQRRDTPPTRSPKKTLIPNDATGIMWLRCGYYLFKGSLCLFWSTFATSGCANDG